MASYLGEKMRTSRDLVRELVVLGIDPGVHTGASLLDMRKPQVEWCLEAEENTWEFFGRGVEEELKMAEELVDLVLKHGVNVISIEDFILIKFESSDRDGLSPVRVTAMFDALMFREFGALYSHKSAVLENDGVLRRSFTASVAKTAWNDSRLRSVGIWAGMSSHQRDAWRHALLIPKRAGVGFSSVMG